MNNDSLKKIDIEVLTDSQLSSIEGGSPTLKTSLAYDVIWCLLSVLIAAGEGASAIKG
nr:bacteriocin [uncultured Bacteroides sp.]